MMVQLQPHAFIVVRGCDNGASHARKLLRCRLVHCHQHRLQTDSNLNGIYNHMIRLPRQILSQISRYSHQLSQTWDVLVTETFGTISGWELVDIGITSEYIQPSGDIELRVSGYHEDTGEQFSDELGIWIREFHLIL